MDADSFRHLLAHFASGVTVVTATGTDGEPKGLTVSAFCSVSSSPPLVLACVDLTSNTLPAIRQSGAFTVNVLASDCERIALAFASKGSSKFDELDWRGPHWGVGGPVLE